jgi:orotidine-5'-phosphate decarboxylase
MNRSELIENIKKKQSFLCVGLDTDLTKIPPHLLQEEDPIFAFNKAIIDATHAVCVAYKPNTAFYEAYGIQGWHSLKKTIDYLNEFYPEIFTIADAKRGDIGNTSSMYAKAFFEDLCFDSVTVAPYMGKDSVTPFLAFPEKWAIVLALTSNVGANDFQLVADHNGERYFEKVVKKLTQWGDPESLMMVVGATRAEDIETVRKIAPDHFFLVPGVGAQGGSLKDVVQYGWNQDCGLLVNSSRGIIYASDGEDFAKKARESAKTIQSEMARVMVEKSFL